MSSATGETLFGREAELRHIYDLIDGAPRAGAALVIRGDPGIGKSACWTEQPSGRENSAFGF